ncbi:ABC transporter ATP-binding protein [Pseudomonas putida S11]|nr:ABC transporter ATP-binding protein [Pseudomonas putida S11]
MIRLRGGSRSFQLGEQQVMGLDGLDLDIAAGDYMAVMGPVGLGQVDLAEHPRPCSTRRAPANTGCRARPRRR